MGKNKSATAQKFHVTRTNVRKSSYNFPHKIL